MHRHEKIDIPVIEAFVKKFAEKYVEQRSQANFDYAELNESDFKNLGFNTDLLKKTIQKNTIPIDKKREADLDPAILNDIYRSDLGELLMTYYFEEKLPDGERFIIPLKNITFRERAELPGRGLDAIGYHKTTDDKIEILLSEAKVSADKKSPPAVVDQNEDSIYKTHSKHKNEPSIIIQRLSDYVRRLNIKEATIISMAILSLSNDLSEHIKITYGCTLIRDYSCVNDSTDYGKMKNHQKEFEPGKVHFSILSFNDKTIDEAVALFYKKVKELIQD